MKKRHISLFISLLLLGYYSYQNYVPLKQNTTSLSNTTKTEVASTELSRVVRVVDGDTVIVSLNGVDEKIRMIGLNTPETVDPRRPVGCFGKEASNEAKRLLTGQSVRVETDPSQGARDKYRRMLAYIFLEDGTNVNKAMIENGFGYEYTYDLPYKYQAEFKQAQVDARENKRGLWAEGVCGK